MITEKRAGRSKQGKTGKSPTEGLSKFHMCGLALLLIMLMLFGALVEFRGALGNSRRTDIGPYLRAAWAVRTGGNIYTVTDVHGWHFVYPPLFAILMTPLADPPQGEDRRGYLPYEVTVGLWYVITMALGIAGIAILAGAIEGRYPEAGRACRFSRIWWAFRVGPLLILLPAIGRCQMRGQVGLLIAFFFCCLFASILKGRRFRAGLWLSAAICIKVIPAILLVFPLWRRDWRVLYGSAVGLLAGAVIIPAIVLGPRTAAVSYENFYRETLVAGVTGDTQGSCGSELTGINSTDSNSPMVVLHNILCPVDKGRRPDVAHWSIRAAHWAIAFAILGVTLLASRWKGRWYSGKVEATLPELAFFSALIPLMLVASPVFHPHYVSMALPLVIVLLMILWQRYSFGNIPAGWKAVFWFVAVSHLLSSIDRGPFLYLRDFGLVLFSTLTLWASALMAVRGPVLDIPGRLCRRTGLT